jgi:hypothetical protein
MLIRILLILSILLGLSPGAVIPPSNLVSTTVTATELRNEPESFAVDFFPVAPYHVGDHLSARVTYFGQEDIGGMEITVAPANQPDQVLGTSKFSQHAKQAVFYWMMNTHEHQPGFIDFVFEIPELGLAWHTGLNLLPPPEGQPEKWNRVYPTCCSIDYITGTDAEEDILQIQQILEDRITEALAQFSSQIKPGENPLEEPLSLALIPSLIGQGGFATDIAVMTYSDRNWAGTNFSTVAHHEIVHVLDRQLNDGPRPSLFAEGLAVYFAGGHYQNGDPLQQAAALIAIDRYIPITEFVDNFYAAQHEISYLEAAGLVAYLSEIWGVEGFLDFYFNLPEAGSDSESISSALEDQFGMTLADLEEDYLAYLQSLDPSREVQENVRLTIETYNTMRRYQKIRVPSAYFRSAWWPPIDRAIELEITGDYASREKAPVEVVIESLLLEVYPALDAGKYQMVEENLAEIKALLDLAEKHGTAFSHYTIGWPLLRQRSLTPGF